MRGYQCEVCGGNCDAGELVGGKRPECLEAERIAIIMQDRKVQLIHAPFEQMILNFGGYENG